VTSFFAPAVGLMNRLTYPRKFLIGAIGFEGRWDYGAIGTVTNFAARLCGEAKAGQILAATRVADAVEDLIESAGVEPVTLKGFHRPMPAVDVLKLKDS
jgi:class 3 adenylate cyclase